MRLSRYCFLDMGRLIRGALGATLIAFGLTQPASAASGPPPTEPVVILTDGVLRWPLSESPDLGWILQQSSDLARWESLGDPLNIAPRPGPVVDLPFVQAQPRSFFRVVPGDRLAREQLLEEQSNRWKAGGLRTYEFEFRWQCFCLPELTPWVRVQVAAGAIVSVRRIEDGREIPPDSGLRYYTVEGLFGWLAEAFERDAARVEVTYDAGLSAPLSGFVDYHEQMADEELGFQVRFPPPPAALLLTEIPARWPGDAYVIEAARREGDWLQLEVAYSGGCVDPHGWELTAVPAPPTPGRPQEVALYLTHDARGDSCESYVHKRLTFGLSSLRGWWATPNPVPLSPSAHLRLGIQDPQSNPPRPYAVLEYEWDAAVFVPWRDVVTATARSWHGGVFGSGSGINYQLVLRFPPSWGDVVQVKTLWIEDRAFTPEVKWTSLLPGGGRLATLSAAFRAIPRLDPDNPGQVLGIDEWPPRDPRAPDYDGAALLLTAALGQAQEWPIPILHELPPVFYP